MLSTKVSDDNYPGDAAASENWPNVGPGARGMNNAISPRYCTLSEFARIEPRPDVLWVRGADVTAARVVGADEDDRTTPHRLWPSDHAGVLADLEV